MKTDAPRETLSARVLLNGAHSRLKLLDALGNIGQFGRQSGNFTLEVRQALSRLAGPVLTGNGIPHVRATPRHAFNQPLFPELCVGVLHRHQRYTELLGVSPTAREAIPRTECSRGDLVSHPGGDLAGVGLPLRL
ncbi:hypothetical protein H180DRAFT_04208 [Streptomyces sp. WMMB 322]|nr:hypothetical protein H180DRAFT_04208 [Streptomyces sp. WMMB 322]